MSRDPYASNQFLQEDGSLPPSPVEAMVHNWLPERKQMLNALQLQFEPYTEDPEGYPPTSVWFTSMRQSMGMVVVAGLLGGLIPFVFNWIFAAQVGVVVPLAELVRSAQQATDTAFSGGAAGVWSSGIHALQLAAGSPPAVFPGWLAAGLSALGLWINWPLQWLGLWIVYGAAVALVAHWLGSPVTLQRFYNLTGYAALPLMLTGLSIIPCFGFFLGLFGVVYALVLYLFAVRAACDFSAGRAIVATVAPAAILIMVGVILVGAFGATLGAGFFMLFGLPL